MSRHVPAPEQIEATRPDRSNWVAANAGAGKTHVLTQRVARLLLAGAPPERILCVTYTKAAAAEMQTRLFRTLGAWAMASEKELARLLGDLEGADAPIGNAETLADARRLFARALETPGGLKIQTIHAFCDALLRRFPLEAGVSPHFEIMDDLQTDALIGRMRVEMAEAAEAGDDAAFDCAARRLNEGGVDDLAEAIMAERDRLGRADLADALRAHYAEIVDKDQVSLARDALGALDPRELSGLISVLAERGGMHEQEIARLLDVSRKAKVGDALEIATALSRELLTNDDRPRQKGLGTKKVLDARPEAEDELGRLCVWALDLRDRLRAAIIVERTRDLHAFGGGLLDRLAEAKKTRGLLDFEDLVTRARELLTERHLRSWVLYKLDQGIDHILIDEAQDTSPAQWAVVEAIAEEFMSGEGARTENRSIFVVGDEKQSIYSFQGAAPRAFGQMRDRFAARLEDLDAPLGRPRLETSYRSAPAILDFADAVFADDAGAELTFAGDPIRHRAHRERDQGRVDLWPLIEPGPAGEDGDWWKRPVDAPSPDDPKLTLADRVARHIGDLVDGERLPAREGAPGAPVRPGDILVLVGARDRLASGIIQGLKERGIEVAGADRLTLGDDLAVQDLMALMKVSTMPSDDLSLAALLRSPLCGLSEEDLFELTHGRSGTLRRALSEAPDHVEAADFLNDMARHADFERPYEFLERALVGHDGRRKLLARLGVEAEDSIDELLVQSLIFEMCETPSLAGFVAWLEGGEITVKREMDRGVDAVRVMTVHGAKGLEAPVVILPDTIVAGRPGGTRPAVLTVEGADNKPDLLVWAGRKVDDDAVARAAREAAEARALAERRRLLYVALTRAEDWLILCGANARVKARDDSWYPMLTAGMERLAEAGATLRDLPSPTGEGEMQRFETGAGAEELPPDGEIADAACERPLPAWLVPAPRETRTDRGSPSDLDDGPGSAHSGKGRDPELARQRGNAIHLALERLPNVAAAERGRAGEEMLARAFPGLDPESRAEALAEVGRVLAMPEAGRIFGPESFAEVAVAIDPPVGGPRMIGRIDRLAPGPDEVLIVDIKTDSRPPDRAEDVQDAYLAQLGAYAAAVAPAWPGRRIALAILWTAAPALMPIDPDAAARAFKSASFGRTARS